MARDSIGELEHLILLTVLNLESDASALRIRDVLATRGGRRITRGALYRSLDRLGEKQLIDWDVVEPDESRGGHTKRFYRVTAAGLDVVRERREALLRLWAGTRGMVGP
ncbi:MAG: PadR family transcriptional regulator [Gemmatimonadota bacterium]